MHAKTFPCSIARRSSTLLLMSHSAQLTMLLGPGPVQHRGKQAAGTEQCWVGVVQQGYI